MQPPLHEARNFLAVSLAGKCGCVLKGQVAPRSAADYRPGNGAALVRELKGAFCGSSDSVPKGFTLIELLASVAVVAVLVALCLAGISGSRRSAEGIKCTANLRNLGAGALAYIVDRNGVLLPSKSFYSASFENTAGFRDYVGLGFGDKTSSAPQSYYVDTVFTCPSMKSQMPGKFKPAILFNRCYSMNEYALFADGDEKAANYPKRLSNIPSLSAMALLMDGSAKTSEPGSFFNVLDESYPSRGLLFYPHGNAQNVLFFDGHISRMSREKILHPDNPRKFWGNLNLPDNE